MSRDFNPDTDERLAISFWIWALWDTGTNGFFNDLKLRMADVHTEDSIRHHPTP